MCSVYILGLLDDDKWHVIVVGKSGSSAMISGNRVSQY